jgi:A/G-specific adenine glycosylase
VTPSFPAARRRAIRRRLTEWYRRSHRDLPWRRTRDPYRIWLSEAMLQQTRVDTVIPFYERFLARFPHVSVLADADEQEVLRAWAGLGYYSRARNLKRAAEIIVEEHGGELPRDAESLRALPGVGAYTAGAIRSIAFGEPAPIVDGNVTRVLSRLLAEPELERAQLWQLASELVEGSEPDVFNQALMELGATVCTPRSPRCAVCPLAGLCRAEKRGTPESFPARRARRPPQPVTALAGLVERRGTPAALLMFRRPDRGLLGGLWEVPSLEGDAPEALSQAIARRTGIVTRVGARVGTVRHAFTHRALTLEVVRLHRTRGRREPPDLSSARWCSAAELADVPLSKLTRKTLALAGVCP